MFLSCDVVSLAHAWVRQSDLLAMVRPAAYAGVLVMAAQAVVFITLLLYYQVQTLLLAANAPCLSFSCGPVLIYVL